MDLDWNSITDAPNFNSALKDFETEAKVVSAVSYTHLTLPTNREV